MVRERSTVQSCPAAPEEPIIGRFTFAGLCASLVGIGLARFAYAPLLPALIGAGWFSPSQATYLAAANLAGYLGGALCASALATRLPVRLLLRGAMLLTALALLACAWPASFLWFFVWRVVSGVTGALLMVLTAPTILPHVPPARRGLVSGAIFMGVGLGVAASGTLVPLLLRVGLSEAWLGLAAACLLLTLVAWALWPAAAPPLPGPAAAIHAAALPRAALRTTYLLYFLVALGLVPHMLFLVDFVSRGLHQGVAAGSFYWVLFGAGAAIGPLAVGSAMDRFGVATTLRLALVVEAAAIVMPALAATPVALALSSVLVGALTPGIVPIVLTRLNALLRDHPAQQRPAWAAATTSFAIAQAAGAYAFSFLLIETGSYALLFLAGTICVVLALALDLFTAARPVPARSTG